MRFLKRRLICMLLIDENMNVMRVNESVRQMIGREYSEIINRSPGGALGCSNNCDNTGKCGENPGCGSCLLRKTISSVIATGEPVNKVETQLILKVGDKLIEPWLSISAKPVNVDEKNVSLLRWMILHLVSRQRRQGGLRRSSTGYFLNRRLMRFGWWMAKPKIW